MSKKSTYPKVEVEDAGNGKLLIKLWCRKDDKESIKAFRRLEQLLSDPELFRAELQRQKAEGVQQP